ncbi:hypothetical protein BH10PLA2_BH10PLA2_36920 [soil metagenome]
MGKGKKSRFDSASAVQEIGVNALAKGRKPAFQANAGTQMQTCDGNETQPGHGYACPGWANASRRHVDDLAGDFELEHPFASEGRGGELEPHVGGDIFHRRRFENQDVVHRLTRENAHG